MENLLLSSKEVETDRSVIETELKHLLQRKRFAGAPQMSAFLRYIVTQTLDGNGDRIKAYSVGVDALGKPHSFDAQNDPSVRVLALRLRKSLKANYEDHLPQHAYITVKVGSYVPEFYKADTSNSADVRRGDMAATLAESAKETVKSAGNSNQSYGSRLQIVEPAQPVANASSQGSNNAGGTNGLHRSDRHGTTLRVNPLLMCLVVATVVSGWILSDARNGSHAVEIEAHPIPSTDQSTTSVTMGDKQGLHLQPIIPTLHLIGNTARSRQLLHVSMLLGSAVVQSGRVNVVRVNDLDSAPVSSDEGFTMVLDEILLDRQSRIVAQLIRQDTGKVVMNEALLLDLATAGFSDKELRWIDDLASSVSELL